MTRTAKHTPGPWSLCKWMVGNNTPTGEVTICGPEGDEHICTMDGSEDNQANGNLIAAAPAMYEALQIMVRAANVDEIDPLVMFASIERARHVLKLAEGKSA